MNDEAWAGIGALGLVGLLALYLAFHFPKQRWPRVIAVTAGGALVSILLGETSAIGPILLTGLVLTMCSVAATSK